MLVASQSLLRYSSLNSVLLLGAEKEGATSIPPFEYVVISAVVLEEHPVPSGNVWKLEKHTIVVRRWELQEAAKIWKKSDLAKGSTSQSKDMGPTCTQVVALITCTLPFSLL